MECDLFSWSSLLWFVLAVFLAVVWSSIVVGLMVVSNDKNEEKIMSFFTYHAKPIRVIDGDTFEAEIDLGFGIRKVDKFRLAGIDTPEIFGKGSSAEKQHGQAAKQFVESLFFRDAGGDLKFPVPLTIHTIRDKAGKYGRFLAVVFLEDGSNLAELLEENGFKKRDDYPEDAD